jgi:hypothetical protein
VLSPDPAALVVALFLRHCTQDTSLKLAVGVGQIDPAGHGGEIIDANRLADIEELLQLARLPVQAVKVVDDDSVDRAGAQVVQQPPVGGPDPALVGGHVLVDVPLDHPPAALLRQPLAILQLTTDRKPITLPIRGDTRVDPDPCSHG